MNKYDYYPFGWEMSGRSFGTDFAYNFNGQRTDKWNGDNGSYLDFGARIQDARLGRFFTIDPKSGRYPNYSPYLYAGNRPIDAVDYEGEGPRYAAIAKAFEKRLNQIKKEGVVNISFKKFDQQDAAGKVLFVVNMKINGQTVSQLFEFNDKASDSKYEVVLRDWGVDFYDAACASSNSIMDRLYWIGRQNDAHYEKFENGGPLLLKTAITLLTAGAALEEFAGMAIWEKALLTVDGTLAIDDMTGFVYGPNATLLSDLAEKAGLDPVIIDKAKTINDYVQGFADLSNIVIKLKTRFKDLSSSGRIAKDEAIGVIEYLNFIGGQIDMQKHYFELMEKGMGDINDKKGSNETQSKKDKYTNTGSF